MRQAALKVVVKLPCGTILSVADLPPDARIHWTMRDKWIVAQAVRFGILSYSGACHRYWMHPEELDDWIEKARQHDLTGLMQKSIQESKRRLRVRPSP